MRILIVNDDGIHAKGLIELANCLKGEHDVTVIAPDRECSGESHRLSFIRPIAYKSVAAIEGCDCYQIHGSPSDCSKIGQGLILGEDIDLIISGINNGENIATDLMYSGTVHAAIEGSIIGVKSIALSLASRHNNYDVVCKFVTSNLITLMDMMPDCRTVININFPTDEADKIVGVKVCPVGERYFIDQYQAVPKRYEGYDNCYLLTGSPMPPNMDNMVYDMQYWAAKYITVSPVKVDFTDHAVLKRYAGREDMFKL